MNMNKRNKIAGAIYGFAIGDAMGATTEFMTAKQIKKKYDKVTDIIGGGWLGLKAGEITDDTQMTMCVMDALMKTNHNQNATFSDMFAFELRKEFIKWYESKPKDVGGQCAKAINRLMRGENFAYADGRALGNGSLMRAMPCALINKPSLNILQGIMTHNNTTCSRVILEYTRLIQNYINCILYTQVHLVNPDFILEPSGYILNTFNNSVYWSNQKSFEEAIIGAVNDGGDADTIAAITGSLAGAKFGYKNIPSKWIDQLDPKVKNILENFKNYVFAYLQI